MHQLSTGTGVAIGVPVVASVCLHAAIAGAILAAHTVFTAPVPEAVGPHYVVVPVVLRQAPATGSDRPSSDDSQQPVPHENQATADAEPAPAATSTDLPAGDLPSDAPRPAEEDASLADTAEPLETADALPEAETAAGDPPPHLAAAPARPQTIIHPPRPRARPVRGRAAPTGPVGPPRPGPVAEKPTVAAPAAQAADAPVASGAAPIRISPQELAAAPGNPPPDYPRSARRNGWEGTAVLTITVGPDGRCESVTVAESSGYQVLDREALKAVRRWRFVPARRFGRAVRATTDVSIVFRLR